MNNILLGQPFAASEKGKRKNNEDAIYPLPEIVSSEDCLFLVCDGVGGKHKGGKTGYQRIFDQAGQTEHSSQERALLGPQQNGTDDDRHMENGGLDHRQVDKTQGCKGEQKDDAGKHSQNGHTLHLLAPLRPGERFFHIQLPPAAVPLKRIQRIFWVTDHRWAGTCRLLRVQRPRTGTAADIIAVLSPKCNGNVENLLCVCYN